REWCVCCSSATASRSARTRITTLSPWSSRWNRNRWDLLGEAGRRADRTLVVQAGNIVVDEAALRELEFQSLDVGISDAQIVERFRPPGCEACSIHLDESRFIPTRLGRLRLFVDQDRIHARRNAE